MTDAPLPYGRQSIDADDIAAVVNVLQSAYLTTGPEVEAFEAELAARCAVQHAIVVSSGTAALHCAYAAAGIGPGDELITSPLTFSATANMMLAQGARPIFADINPQTLCLEARHVERALTPRVRAIVPVDFAGHPADRDALRQLARQHDICLIADAAHALGSRWRGEPVAALADLTTFSFHPVKTMTTAEGGAVLTDNPTLARRARDFRNHGLVRDPARLPPNAAPWSYAIMALGFNYRLSALHCALGRSQLRKLDRFVQRRAQIVQRYRAAFSGHPALRLVDPSPHAQVAWHLFTVQLRAGSAARAALFAALVRDSIQPQVHYIPVNAMPLYRQLGYTPTATPLAAAAADALMSLPLFFSMTDADVERVIDRVLTAVAYSVER